MLKTTYSGQQSAARRIVCILLGCLLAGAFLLAALWALLGGLHFAGNLGDFLNLVLDRLAEKDLRIHDDFAAAEGVSPLFLLAASAGSCLFAVVLWAALQYRLWPVLWAVLLIQTGLQLWLPGCPWPVDGLFYLVWAVSALWAAAGGVMKPGRLCASAAACALILAALCLILPQPAQSLLDTVTEEKNAAVLPRGDFSDLQPLELGEKPCLKVTMDRPASYYLKGYTGEVYNGSGWESLDGKTLAASNDLFYWLHEKDFWGSGQLGKAAELLETEEDAGGMKIEFAKGADRHLLQPYETIGGLSAAAPLIGDSLFVTEAKDGVKAYDLKVSAPQLGRKSRLLEKLRQAQESEDGQAVQDYLRCENSYRKFVYANYTELDHETAAVLEKALGEPAPKDPVNTAQVKAKVLKLLAGFEYDENTTYSREEGDFLSVFLQDRTGWSVHHATAAALMFRYYGIPARYAEGYLITPQDVKDAEAGKAVAIDSGHAHSWMEYYEDGLGWVPFETTGPYIGVMGSDDAVSYSSGGGQEQKPQKQEKKKEKEQKIATLETEIMEHALLILSGLVLLLLVLAALLVLLGRRRLRKKQGIGIADDRQALTVMLGYILTVMEKRGMTHRNLPMSAYSADVTRLFGQQLGEDFSRAARIYEDGRYSGRAVLPEDRAFVEGLVKDIRKKTRRKEREA